MFCLSIHIGEMGDKGQKGSMGRHGKIGPIGSKGMLSAIASPFVFQMKKCYHLCLVSYSQTSL